MLEKIVNNDSQITDEILTVNREKFSEPITDGLLNIAGLLQELPLPTPQPGDIGHHSLLSHLPDTAYTNRLLKRRHSVIISKMMDCLSNTNMEPLEMIDENYREISHSGQMPILLKTLLERNPDIFNNSSDGLDQESIRQFSMENDKSDSAANNPYELSDNRHEIPSKESKSKHKLSRRRKCNIECSPLSSLQNNSNDSLSCTSQVAYSSNVIVRCQSVPNENPPENSNSKISAEGVNIIHSSEPDSSPSVYQSNKKIEIVNQLENKQNNFDEKRASTKEFSDVLSKFNLEDQTVAENSFKQIKMRKVKSCSQYYELSDIQNISLEKSHSEIYTQVNRNLIPDSNVQQLNLPGCKIVYQHGNKTNNTDIGENSARIFNPVVVLPKLSIKDIKLAEKSVKQFTIRNRKTELSPERLYKKSNN